VEYNFFTCVIFMYMVRCCSLIFLFILQSMNKTINPHVCFMPDESNILMATALQNYVFVMYNATMLQLNKDVFVWFNFAQTD